MRPMRTVRKSSARLLRMARRPLVSRLAADPVARTQRTARLLPFNPRRQKLQTLLHHAGLSPTHRRSLPPAREPVTLPPGLPCYLSTRSVPLGGPLPASGERRRGKLASAARRDRALAAQNPFTLNQAQALSFRGREAEPGTHEHRSLRTVARRPRRRAYGSRALLRSPGMTEPSMAHPERMLL